MDDNLKPGLTGTARLTVGEAHTAPSIGSGKIRVLGTPVMINLMEAAALDAAERFLAPGHQSLGTRLDVSHVAATPVGLTVTATATLTEVQGNRLFFDVSAHDGVDTIGQGTHQRVVVDVARFDARAARKAPQG